MKHMSMLPPQEPAYRLRLELRKLKWAEQERRAAELEMQREKQARSGVTPWGEEDRR